MKNPAPLPWTNGNVPPWAAKLRPLSDIREMTEPSLIDTANRDHDLSRKPSISRADSLSRKTSLKRKKSLARNGSQHSLARSGHTIAEVEASVSLHSIQVETQSDHSSAYSLSLENVPPRSSSRRNLDIRGRSLPLLRQPDSTTALTGSQISLLDPKPMGYRMPNKAAPRSPLKKMISRDSLSQLVPGRHHGPRTFIRTTNPNTDIIDFPTHRHPRVSADLQVGSALFFGGSTIEGRIKVNVQDVYRAKHKAQFAIGRVSLDLLGIEEMNGAKRSIFLNLATELIDHAHPPPHQMVTSLKQISPTDPFWLLAPSLSSLPFILNLPVDIGPPSFQSKHARIRYTLAVTILVRDQGKQYLVRSSQEISVLPVYDPEKALVSLPIPLTVSDEYTRSRDISQRIHVTAGLHRQVWVCGTSIFVDTRIENQMKKPIKRMELQVERNILFYKHTAATLERTVNQARVFDSNERIVLGKKLLKASPSSNWAGVAPGSTEIRTFDLELPRGNATVKCGKFFEVRYFLNVLIGSSSKPKLINLQLPIVLIHMNSLDVVPNAVANVANASEAKSSRVIVPTNRSPKRLRATEGGPIQGRAFAAPRKQSQERVREELVKEDIAELSKILDASPRRYKRDLQQRPPGIRHKPNSNHVHGNSSSSNVMPMKKLGERQSTVLSNDQSSSAHHLQPPFRGPAPRWPPRRVLLDPPNTPFEDARNRLRRIRSAEVFRSNSLVRPGPLPNPGKTPNRALQEIPLSRASNNKQTETTIQTQEFHRITRRRPPMKTVERSEVSAAWIKEGGKTPQKNPRRDGNWI
ncbi:hypothetical protein BT63DRAFT_274752 [Microthyrium microscopicum]|uniref:Arrestin C-terminal-like domain-containing protein n=1 Tax=Microthyrium microscopicum TaxID=703497 RepID=A0A6A6U9V2_9PEZI|nr:hypothetical protein BT63DRAFT_274752 [Microthyrium microscopicum]